MNDDILEQSREMAYIILEHAKESGYSPQVFSTGIVNLICDMADEQEDRNIAYRGLVELIGYRYRMGKENE